jgi:hypothetical protein
VLRRPGIAAAKTLDDVADELGLLAAAEIAGAAGIVIGLFWWPIGVVAAGRSAPNDGAPLELAIMGRRSE